MIKVKYIALLLCLKIVHAQVNPKEVEIVRDTFGVPHIFAKTDAGVAYGLAWAHAEDDFNTIQLAYLAGNNLLANHLGNKGIPADFIAQLIASKEIATERYETDISPEYKKVLEGYATGLNHYASVHPEEVLVKELFPVNPFKMLRYAQLQLFISSRGDYWLRKIIQNELKLSKYPEPNKGSNTFAFNSMKTVDGSTMLAINTHQPLDGPVSWYEAHLHSEEGTNILGALFAGSPTILIGANEYLGWAHTVNYVDKTDVFALEMHPKEKNKYKVDESYLMLEKKKARLRVKVLGIPFKINKKYYQSIYGPTLKNKSGFFAVRTPALFEVRALEQWWRMGKSKSFSEFYKTLKMKALPGYNIGYADRNDTIFYISNGLIPKRAKGYDWKDVVPGNTRKTLWTETYAVEELPQVIQPASGYVYNANHSPFFSSDVENNPQESAFDPNMGFELYNNNRSTRIKELIDSYDKITYADFKTIKYDGRYPTPFNFNFMDISALEEMKPEEFDTLGVGNLLRQIQNWDRNTNADSFGAGAFAILYNKLTPYYSKLPEPKVFKAPILIKALQDTKAHMLEHFGTEKVRLGDYQKLVRGQRELPSFGFRDVITAMSASPYEGGKTKVHSGESYIELIRFTSDGPQIESVISYGSSDHPESKHFSDQMEMYLNFETKSMTLDKEAVYENAVKIYHPGEKDSWK